MEKYITKSFIETQKLGQDLARQILAAGTQKNLPAQAGAVVLALHGDLGAGKTTFLQGFAKGLGIKENVLSPTFVIMKKFKIAQTSKKTNITQMLRPQEMCYAYFYHLDCYRLNNPEEILHLGFKEIISNPENIVAIEWPEKIKKILPKNIISITFGHLEENKREIIFDKK